jgi:hypothetical protein
MFSDELFAATIMKFVPEAGLRMLARFTNG